MCSHPHTNLHPFPFHWPSRSGRPRSGPAHVHDIIENLAGGCECTTMKTPPAPLARNRKLLLYTVPPCGGTTQQRNTHTGAKSIVTSRGGGSAKCARFQMRRVCVFVWLGTNADDGRCANVNQRIPLQTHQFRGFYCVCVLCACICTGSVANVW